MNRTAQWTLAGVLLLCVACQSFGRVHDYQPPAGIVPDSLTAVRIALAVWNAAYGEQLIAQEAPYVARLEGDVWTVQGSMPEGQGLRGGVALIELSRRTGRVLRLTHGK